MPLINTQSEIDHTVGRMLEAAGIGNKDSSLATKLSENGLGTDECIEQLADLARNGDPKDGIRLRAIETGLKLNGVLKESNQQPMPTFTIIINDGASMAINPILIPRVQ